MEMDCLNCVILGLVVLMGSVSISVVIAASRLKANDDGDDYRYQDGYEPPGPHYDQEPTVTRWRP